ncbi:MAG: dihydroorotate dehydrogenase-like protein [Pseudomonadota bacterium]|nr:MAG: dihydroorotate dehydrogenase-like protein [Pseudomonadota bacterium]
MTDLSTRYLGLELSNPLVPSASPLSRSLDTARELEDAGAAAIVMYSLFEEELRHEEESAARFLVEQDIGYGEASSFLPFDSKYTRSLDQYLEQLAALKNSLGIPVIASLNGVSLDGWVKHGVELQQAGADALELNVYYVAARVEDAGSRVEARYLELLRELRNYVNLPITVKLSPQFSSLPHFVQQLQAAGANGISMFNRFYQPDIDLDSMRIVPQLRLSRSEDSLLAMRWIAILYERVKLSLAATGGIHNAADAIKVLMAGADVAHLCSTLLLHGPHHLGAIKLDLQAWLEHHEYASVAEIQGRLSQRHTDDPAAFERANYLWVLDNYTSAAGVMR